MSPLCLTQCSDERRQRKCRTGMRCHMWELMGETPKSCDIRRWDSAACPPRQMHTEKLSNFTISCSPKLRQTSIYLQRKQCRTNSNAQAHKLAQRRKLLSRTYIGTQTAASVYTGLTVCATDGGNEPRVIFSLTRRLGGTREKRAAAGEG